MINTLINTNCYYPLCSGEYYIYDNHLDNKPSFVSKDDKWNLNISNKSQNTVHFLQNDGCIMTENEVKKCDWVCFLQNKFYFIEAKDVKAGQRKKNRADAVEKFEATIPYFFNLYPSIESMKIYVIMNFRSKNKITNAATKFKQDYFKEKFNAAYREANIIEFT